MMPLSDESLRQSARELALRYMSTSRPVHQVFSVQTPSPDTVNSQGTNRFLEFAPKRMAAEHMSATGGEPL